MTKVSQVTYGMYLFASDYADTTYTEKMKNSELPFCVLYGNGIYTRAISILDESKAKALMDLSEQSSILYPAETGDNAEPVEQPTPDTIVGAIATQGGDKTEDPNNSDESESSNIVVIGSNYAVTDSFLSSNMYGNAQYMSALLNTLVGRDNVGVQIESQSLKADTLNITSVQLGVFTVLFVVVLPLAILITGIIIFVRRRNK